jgi:hypothetical protein
MIEPPICPECGNEAKLVDSKIVYDRSYGNIWYCGCVKEGVYVGCKRGTDKPLGTLANARLRYYRKRAHRAFDPLWSNKTAEMTRTDAYHWLASRINVPLEECHIAMFDEEMCKVVERVARHKRGLLDVKNPKR